MALQKQISTDYGIDGNYIKITNINANKESVSMTVHLYASQTARANTSQPLTGYVFECALPTGTGNDLLVDLYAHLKTLPEFAGATDV